MRVPLGARRCSLNWPLSTAGKKSSPTQRARNNDATQAPRKAAVKSAAPVDALLEQRTVAVAHPHEASIDRALQRSRTDCATGRRCRAPRARAAGTSPSSAPACATGRRTPASRRRPPRPSARRGSARRRSGRTSARRRCRCRSSRRTPASAICSDAVENGRLQLLALLQVPVDVLDRHRRVVDQHADGERQAAERHDVDRLAQRAAGR